jgi:hypothetical protein
MMRSPAVPMGRPATQIGVFLSLAVVACSIPDNSPPTDDTAGASAPATATTAHGDERGQDATVTSIEIVIAGTTVTAQLAGNPTSQDFAGQLPLALTFRDLNRVERIAKLPRPLTTEGVPDGDDPEIADIGYYAPTQELVLYYGDVGYWNGIVRIGRFDSDQLSLVAGQPDGFHATVERP